LASGIAGIKTLSNLGSGVKDLVTKPVKQYQEDGRVMKGLASGTSSFIAKTTMESINVTNMLVMGAQAALGKVEDAMAFTSQNETNSALSYPPKDIAQGITMGLHSLNTSVKAAKNTYNTQGKLTIPLAMLKPVIGLADGLSRTLIGLQNTLDRTHYKRMEEKYKHY
jgi:hypothetical protein